MTGAGCSRRLDRSRSSSKHPHLEASDLQSRAAPVSALSTPKVDAMDAQHRSCRWAALKKQNSYGEYARGQEKQGRPCCYGALPFGLHPSLTAPKAGAVRASTPLGAGGKFRRMRGPRRQTLLSQLPRGFCHAWVRRAALHQRPWAIT